MPNGLDYVEATLAKIGSVSAATGALAGVEAAWVAGVQGRLTAVAELLKGTIDRFFLKTRVCLPFARKCEQAVDALGTLLAEQSGPLAEDGRGKLEAALETLEKAARTLDERSMMQGMAIT